MQQGCPFPRGRKTGPTAKGPIGPSILLAQPISAFAAESGAGGTHGPAVLALNHAEIGAAVIAELALARGLSALRTDGGAGSYPAGEQFGSFSLLANGSHHFTCPATTSIFPGALQEPLLVPTSITDILPAVKWPLASFWASSKRAHTPVPFGVMPSWRGLDPLSRVLLNYLAGSRWQRRSGCPGREINYVVWTDAGLIPVTVRGKSKLNCLDTVSA